MCMRNISSNNKIFLKILLFSMLLLMSCAVRYLCRNSEIHCVSPVPERYSMISVDVFDVVVDVLDVVVDLV